jgi:peptide/nickel transport system substrate-binding protein
MALTDTPARNAIWGQIDQAVMNDSVILPGGWAKALTLRSKHATNVFINDAFGQYDYAAMGAA